MQMQDDRTEAERVSHPVLWIGTDSFMSGWGKADGGTSYAAWACRPEDSHSVERWVRGRSEMRRVRDCYRDWNPRGNGHAHIYVVRDGHPAIT